MPVPDQPPHPQRSRPNRLQPHSLPGKRHRQLTELEGIPVLQGKRDAGVTDRVE